MISQFALFSWSFLPTQPSPCIPNVSSHSLGQELPGLTPPGVFPGLTPPGVFLHHSSVQVSLSIVDDSSGMPNPGRSCWSLGKWHTRSALLLIALELFPARRKSGPSCLTPSCLISEDASRWWLVCVLQLISLHLSLHVSPKNSMDLEEILVIWSRTFACRLSTRISAHPTFYSSSSYLPCWSNLLLF